MMVEFARLQAENRHMRAVLEMVLEIARNPTVTSLEVGFRHTLLSDREARERMEMEFSSIVSMIDTFMKRSQP